MRIEILTGTSRPHSITDEEGRSWGASLFQKRWQKILASYLKNDCLILAEDTNDTVLFENQEKVQFKRGQYFLPKRLSRQLRSLQEPFRDYLDKIKDGKI